MSQARRGASTENLFWFAALYLLLGFGDFAYAQSPDVTPISPAGAATPAASDSAPPDGTVPSRLGPGSEAVAGSGMPAYKLLRYDEDYSYLKDPTRRTDFWDPIKYIPIGNRDDWYVSFGAQSRQWFQFYNNFDFGTTPGPNAF